MDFIHKITREEVTFAQLKERFPLTLFPGDFAEDFEDYAPVHPAERPEHNPATHKVIALPPVEADGAWQQQWEVVPLTQQEIDDARRALVPPKVTRRQGRLALLAHGHLDDVEAVIDAIADPAERRAAQIEYEADTWERSNAFLQSMWAQLGGTPAQLDDLFRLAVTL